MCVMLPWRVVELGADTVRVRSGDAELQVNGMLLPDLAVGDWVLVNAGMAVRQLSDEAAEEVTRILTGDPSPVTAAEPAGHGGP